MAEPKQQMEDSSRLMSNHCATTSVVVNFLNTYSEGKLDTGLEDSS